MEHPVYSREEVAARGRAIYEEQIRSRVEPEHEGEFVVIDVDTGEYEIGKDDVALMKRAAERHPVHSLYGMRVGHRTMGRIGARRAS
jgi:ferredoxin